VFKDIRPPRGLRWFVARLRRSRGRWALGALVVVICACAAWQPPLDAAAQIAQLVPEALATRIATPIVLDGVLDEAAWRQATPIGPLHQVDPDENQPATNATEIRIVYTADTLYFGIHCIEPRRQIVAAELRRDGDIFSDDHVVIALGPFFDHRNGFFFQVNPVGARGDGQISDNSDFLDQSWDGIWDARARITEHGWDAEIAIPFKTLRFTPGTPAWDLNVEREVKAINETDRWATPLHKSWVSNFPDAGQLAGLTGLRQGLGLDVRPYASAGELSGAGQHDVGLDIFKNLTPNLNASVTINTDFAQTEADDRQVNLTPYKLFFPEKRAFFLEGSGVFNVPGLGNSDLMPFFSRQIGLLNVDGRSEQVPILAGAKVTGRQGDYNIGLLDVQTRSAPDDLGDGQNLFAARVSRNLLSQSQVGAIVTHGSADGGDNLLVGGDAKFATATLFGDRNFEIDLYALRTKDANAGSDDAFGFRVDYPNDLWNAHVNWKQIGDRFAPALGFVNRTGIRKVDGHVSFQPRPSGSFVRQFFFQISPNYITNLNGEVLDWRLELTPLNIDTNEGEHVEIDIVPQFEELLEPFEISDGVVLPPGPYRWTDHQVHADTADKRWWQLHFDWALGGFYNGTNRYLHLGATLKPSRHVSFDFNANRNDITLNEGRFYAEVLSFRGNLNLSPNVSWSNLVQYDNQSRELGGQSRFHWILEPGRDLFIVLNRGWIRTPSGVFLPNFDSASAKLQYTVRF
jgi:hypothetical protein